MRELNTAKAIKELATTYALKSHTHSYLPLSGGTMTGPIMRNGVGACFILANDTSRTMMYASTNKGHHIFGGNNNGSTEPTDYIRVGLNLLEYQSSGVVHKIYHDGHKPTVTEIGAAPASHTHSYLPLGGGTITGVTKVASTSASPLTLERTDNDANLSLIFKTPTNAKCLGIAKGVLKFGDSADLGATGHEIYHAGNKPTPAEIGAAPTSHGHASINVTDNRDTNPTPNDFTDRSITTFFNNKYGDTWRSGITIKGWSDGYNVWQLSNPSSTELREGLAFRSGIGTTWNPWRKIYHEGFKPTPADIGAATDSHTHSYLPLTGGTLSGKITMPKGFTVHSANASGGTTGFIHVAELKITATYSNHPIALKVAQRGKPSVNKLEILFQNANNTDPALQSFTKTGNINAVMHKASAGVWNLYIEKTEAYDHIEIVEINKSSYIDKVIITWKNAIATTLPTGYVSASYKNEYIDITGRSAAATKLETARTINGTSFDGSANITTANWGTARTITIGSTSKSVNGSGNISWSLAEIGAVDKSSGMGQQLASYSVSNVNTISGTKIVYSTSSATGKPTGTDHSLFQMAYSDAWKSQIAHDWRTNNLYVRGMNNTSWLSWKQVAYTDSNITGNANTATTLQTARTLTIGSTGKSFNGSGNVSWSLSEIGAAAASHSHSYLPTSGGSLSGSLNVTSQIYLNTGSATNSHWYMNSKWSGNSGTECSIYPSRTDGYGFVGALSNPIYQGYAYKWVVASRRTAKYSINKISSEDMYDYIKNLNVYLYRHDSSSVNPETELFEANRRLDLQLGCMIDELPTEVVNYDCENGDGKSVDLYSYSTMVLGATKHLQDKVETLEKEKEELIARLDRMEEILNGIINRE